MGEQPEGAEQPPQTGSDGQPQWAGQQPQWAGQQAGGAGSQWNVPIRPRPGIIPLRPISLGEIYDGSFQAIRTNPGTMIGISGIVVAVTSLLSLLPQAAATHAFFDKMTSPDLLAPNGTLDLSGFSSAIATFFASIIPVAIIAGIALTVLSGMLIVAVSAAVLGRKTPPGVLWRRTRRRIPALIGLSLLVSVLSFGAALLSLVPGILVAVAGSPGPGVALAILGLIPGILVGAWLWTRWSCAAPSDKLPCPWRS